MSSGLFIYLKVFYLFILKERERVSMSGGGAGRKRERISSRLSAISTEPNPGLNPTDHEVMT